MTSSLVDICFNFAHESFQSDRNAVLQRARDAGIDAMLITGSTLQDSSECIELCRLAPDSLFSTAGVHPHYASDWDATSSAGLRQLLDNACVRAVGECGLDYNRDYSPRERQRYALQAQLELAVETGLPVFLHERDAHDDLLRLLQDYLPHLDKAVVHCFTGSASQLQNYLAAGLYIGITGWICDERRGLELQQMAGLIPPGKLMIETDAPYLLPRDLRPKPASRRNEPAFLRHICAAVARHRGESADAVAYHTRQTARHFYRLPNRAENL